MTGCAAAIVLYNKPQEIYRVWKRYDKSVDKIYVIDNSELANKQLYEVLHKDNKFVLFESKGNLGIAKALNIASTQAYNDGFKYLLLMDQDCYFDEGELTCYINKVKNCENKRAAIFAPQLLSGIHENASKIGGGM